jgi:DNA processing protein
MTHPMYWIALQLVLGIASKKLRTVLDFFRDAEEVFEASPMELSACPALNQKDVTAILQKPFAKAKEIWDTCERLGISVITPDDVLYPENLWHIPDMPCVLYVKGRMPRFDRLPAVSIVGTRKPTVYGRLVCQRVASVLAVAGVTVISGGAMGIDATAHKATLDVGGITLAVLGCGIDYPYLKENQSLRQQITQKGALISEYPPKTPPTRRSFPIRNRLISALSAATVVIEAGEKSGSLITANCALEQGKEVFALPGSVMSPSFLGSNRILSQGAHPVFSGLDVLKLFAREYFNVIDMNRARELHRKHLEDMLVIRHSEFAVDEEDSEEIFEENSEESFPTFRVTVLESAPKSEGFPDEIEENSPKFVKKTPKPLPKDLSEAGQVVYNALLDAGKLTLAALSEATDLTTVILMQELTLLELNGYVEKDGVGEYKLVNPIKE